MTIDADLPPPGSNVALRDQLSSLQSLLVLSMLMTKSSDEARILYLATTSVPSYGQCRLDGAYLLDAGWKATSGPCEKSEVRTDLEAQFAILSDAGGAVAIQNEGWGWAFPLRSLEGDFGYLVVGTDQEPPRSAQFMLRVLAQQTGIALANARVHTRERAAADDLRIANGALAKTVAALERSTAIHDRLTQVAVAGEGREGIARALCELTGFPIAVEDRYGNLCAWSGPERPDPYPKDEPAVRERMLDAALLQGEPVRDGDRVLAVARPSEDLVGAIVLLDPEGKAGEHENVALEHGATVLGMELARLQSLAETELRLGRDLVEELLGGTDEQNALARARALGYDLERPHRVVLVEGHHGSHDGETFFHAVRRAARDHGIGSFLSARAGAVVVLSDIDQPWSDFRSSVLAELPGGRCRVGVGGVCGRPSEFPRSHREAQLALRMQDALDTGDQATTFEQLGIYRLLAQVEDVESVEQLVRHWLGPLLDYDSSKPAELVSTLSQYLECGKSYEATAKALAVHRSTLKYRLQRISDISGHDLSDADTNFNLQLATRAWKTLVALRTQES
jgi:sugar diacid utilization regulator